MNITVAVPTIAGREKYLASCLRTCISQPDDFEILVSDNPGGAAREVVDAIRDPRIRYVTPPRYLPMSAHWDFVLTQASGELMTIIGDDDGLMPGCIKRVKEIQSQAKGIPIHHALANYWWPDVEDRGRQKQVEFFHPVGQGLRIASSSDFLNRVARARARYVDGPMVYHNFIPTSLLRAASHNGIFFHRSSPDVFSSLAIAASAATFVTTDELLTISGQGAKANGQAVRLGAAETFMAEATSLYPSRFPGRTVQMVLLDCLFEVAERSGRPELLSNLHLGAHFAAAFREARGMADERRLIVDAARTRGLMVQSLTARAISIIRGRIKGGPTRVIDHVFEQGDFIRTQATDIFEATLELQSTLVNTLGNSSPHSRSLSLA